ATEPIVPGSVFIKARVLDLQPPHSPTALAIEFPDNQVTSRSFLTAIGAGVLVLKSRPQGGTLSYGSASQKRTEMEDELALVILGGIRCGCYCGFFHLVEGIEGHCVKIFELKTHHADTSGITVAEQWSISCNDQLRTGYGSLVRRCSSWSGA